MRLCSNWLFHTNAKYLNEKSHPKVAFFQDA